MMKYFLILVLLIVQGCGGESNENVGADPDGFRGLQSIYISPTDGIDSAGRGAIDKPVRSITYALNIAEVNQTIVLKKGIYSIDNGEIFPLYVRNQIDIEVDNGAVGRVIISGSGLYTDGTSSEQIYLSIVLNEGSEIKGTLIRPGANAVGVALQGVNHSIINNVEIDGGAIGILVDNSSPIIQNSIITNNNINGITVVGGSNPTILGNVIVLNHVGILVDDHSKPQFLLEDKLGKNSFQNNAKCDFFHRGSERINLIGSLWDDNEFEFLPTELCDNGANLVIDNVGFADYQLIPDKNIQLFSGTQKIDLIRPSFGAILFEDLPDFLWSGPANTLVVAAVFEAPPLVVEKQVATPQDIIWLWHSGLPTGHYGKVNYEEGGRPNNGDISDLGPPIPLQSNKSYYWAVWEWGEEGLQISASSPIYYFIAK